MPPKIGPRERPTQRLAIAMTALAALTWGAACSLNQEGVPPPANDLFFPAGTLVDSTGRWLFVTNSNSDLRYNDGTLAVVDLQRVAADRTRTDWETCPRIGYVRRASEPNSDYCCWDVLDPGVLNCDSRKYIDPTSTVRVGSFAGAMVWQPYCAPPAVTSTQPREACDPATTRGRLLIPVRGNSSLTVVDTEVVGSGADARLSLRCTDAAEAAPFHVCDDSYRVIQPASQLGNPEPDNPIRLPEEPYAVALDPVLQLLYVGHLRGGVVSLLDVGWGLESGKPSLVAPYPRIFPNDGNGLSGVTSLTIRNDAARTLYATSRYVPRAGALVPTRVDLGSREALTYRSIALVATGDVFDTRLPGGAEFRGLTFLPDVPRAYVLQRTPPALVGFDVKPNAEGRMSATPVDFLETCSGPTFLEEHDAGSGLRLYVTCYESGQLYVFDPYLPRLITIIEVGRGPAGVSFDAPTATSRGQFAYVTGFGANNLSVVDLRPGSPTEHRVIQRVGFASPVPR